MAAEGKGPTRFAIEVLEDAVDAAAFRTAIGAGIGGGTDDQTAAEVPFSPTGGIAATDVQAALAEVAGDVTSHAALTDGAHGITTFGASLVNGANAAAARTTLGLGTAATQASGAFEAAGAVSTHEGLGDPHPQYMTVAEGNAAYSVLGHLHDDRYYTEAEIDALLAGLPGGGDVTGPLLAVDDRIATFDGITGKLIQDSGSTVANVVARANHTGTQLASTISDFAEAVDDRVGALLVAGTNVTLDYNDGANTLTINASGGGGSGASVDELLAHGAML